MTVELTMLAYSAGLFILVVLVQAATGVIAQGPLPMAGSRDNLPPPKTFQARMNRVVANHVEGLAMFAPVVLVAAQAGISTPMTVLGAQLFFFSRVAHAVLYAMGAPFVRPIVWTVGLVGVLMILRAVLGLG